MLIKCCTTLWQNSTVGHYPLISYFAKILGVIAFRHKSQLEKLQSILNTGWSHRRILFPFRQYMHSVTVFYHILVSFYICDLILKQFICSFSLNLNLTSKWSKIVMCRQNILSFRNLMGKNLFINFIKKDKRRLEWN